MMDYQTANAQLRGRDRRKIANNTFLVRRSSNAIALRLHATDVLTFHEDGRVVYDSGGWLTVTTKARMNAYGPLAVWSKRRVWHIADRLYHDGVTVYVGGSFYPPNTFVDTPEPQQFSLAF